MPPAATKAPPGGDIPSDLVSPRTQQAIADAEFASQLQEEENAVSRAPPGAPPPAPQQPLGTFLTLEFQDITLGESMKLNDCALTVTVQGPDGNELDVQTTQPLPPSQGAITEMTLPRQIRFRQPLETLGPKSSVFIEFKHLKESKMSVRCWCLTNLELLFTRVAERQPTIELPLYKKPTLWKAALDSRTNPVPLNSTGSLKINVVKS